MKKYFLLMAMALVGLSFTACSDDDETQGPGETNEYSVESTVSGTWKYVELATGTVVGTGDATADAAWFARTDWDIAISRYLVRTNSGTSTTAGAGGGVYTYPASASFASVANVPSGAEFVADKIFSDAQMGGGTVDRSRSEAAVVTLRKDADGSTIMPPVYDKTPVYIFRSANGASYYKVDFTQYMNEEGAQGYVKFNIAQIYQ